MTGIELKRTRESYLTGPESSELHTVDIWRPDSVPFGQESEGLWLMLVSFSLRHNTH